MSAMLAVERGAGTFWKGIDLVTVVQGLIIAQVIALMVSPPVTNILELLLFIAFFSSPVLRSRLVSVVRQPFVLMGLLLYVFLGIGLIYGVDTLDHTIKYWLAWRRLLLIPLVVAAFDDAGAKERVVWVFLWAIIVGVLLSFGTHLLNIGVYKYEPGIVIRNHTTQGMFFVAGSFSAFLMLKYRNWTSPFQRVMLWVALLLPVANIVLINTSRSTYLALFLLTGYGVFLSLHGWRLLMVLAATILAVPLLFWMSPVIHQRINQAVSEAAGYREAESVSSMGARMIFLQNTLPMVFDRPMFGYGTGSFELAYRRQVAGMEGWRAGLTNDPHNQYLKIYIENGLVGLLLFLGFIGSAFWQDIHPLWRQMGISVILMWCATSIFNSHFSTFSEGRFLVLWCGIMLAMPACRGGIKAG